MNGKTPKLVKPGDPIRASDFNDIQRALAPINGQGGNFQSLIQSPFLESGWVWVKNDTATAVARFETMRLKTEDLLSFSGFDLAGDSRGIILKITDVSTFANPTLAIAIEPIAKDGGLGRACISGLCRAKLLSGSTSLKNATVSGRKLQPASSGPVSLLSGPSSSAEITALVFIDRATGGALVRIFRTPSGGIAANGSAVCDELNEARSATIGTATIFNHRSSIIPGNVDVLAMSSGTKLWIVEGNCPTSILPPAEEP